METSDRAGPRRTASDRKPHRNHWPVTSDWSDVTSAAKRNVRNDRLSKILYSFNEFRSSVVHAKKLKSYPHDLLYSYGHIRYIHTHTLVRFYQYGQHASSIDAASPPPRSAQSIVVPRWRCSRTRCSSVCRCHTQRRQQPGCHTSLVTWQPGGHTSLVTWLQMLPTKTAATRVYKANRHISGASKASPLPEAPRWRP